MKEQKKKRLKEEISVISDLNKDNLRKLEVLENEVSQLKNGHEIQVNSMRWNIETREQRIDDMELEIIELKDKILKQENKHQDSSRKKDKDLQVIDERLKNKYRELISAKKELIEARDNLKKTLETLKSSDRRADAAEEKCEEMREEMKKKAETQAQEQSLVANSEKPGPERVEETEPEESSQLQTTGGNLGDSEGEGEATFTRPNTPHSNPYPRGKIEENGGRRRERVVMYL